MSGLPLAERRITNPLVSIGTILSAARNRVITLSPEKIQLMVDEIRNHGAGPLRSQLVCEMHDQGWLTDDEFADVPEVDSSALDGRLSRRLQWR